MNVLEIPAPRWHHDGGRFLIPPPRRLSQILLLASGILLFSYFSINMLRNLLARDFALPELGPIGTLIPVCALVIAGVWAIFLAWQVTGTEEIEVGASTLTIRRTIAGVANERQFQIGRIEGLTVASRDPCSRANRPFRFSLRQWAEGSIRFINDSECIRFGAALEDAEARLLCEALVARQPKLGRSEASDGAGRLPRGGEPVASPPSLEKKRWTFDGSLVVLRPRFELGQGEALLLLIWGGLGWNLVEPYLAFGDDASPPNPSDVLLLLPLTLLVISLLVRRFTSRELLEFKTGRLRLVLPRVLRQHEEIFELSAVSSLHSKSSAEAERRLGRLLPWRIRRGSVLFDYGARSYAFGARLTEPEARALVEELIRHHPSLA